MISRSRAYRLGFSAAPPRLETAAVLLTANLWTQRADRALLSLTVPWNRLLADTSASLLVRRDETQLVQLYRSREVTLPSQARRRRREAEPRMIPTLPVIGTCRPN